MKIGILSDAHGNLPGLLACLRALRTAGAERICFLGDAVGYFPDGVPVLEALAEAGAVCVKGNHEAMLLGELPLDSVRDEVYRLVAQRRKLPENLAQHLAGWPTSRVERVGSRTLLLVHGSPWEELTGYVYPDSNLAPFASLSFDAVFLGHTHRPFERVEGSVRVVNVGSCGLPRDGGGLASCVLYDGDSGMAEVLRVPLDVNDLLERYGASIHPNVAEVLRRAGESPLVGRRVEVR